MGVLIAFLTRSDPAENPAKPGPATVLTAVKALRPEYVHLLYTELTEENLKKTEERIREDPDFRRVPIERHKLELSDARDYKRLADVLPNELAKIAWRHPGRNFYLVSGHPQVRLVMALCLTSYVLEGELYEVDDPDRNDPWPKNREGYQKRLRVVPVEVIQRFRSLTQQHQQWERAILRIDLTTEEVTLKAPKGGFQKLELKKRRDRFRTFEILVYLVAKKCYGGGNQKVTRKELQPIYAGHNISNVRHAIRSINVRAQKIISKDLIKNVERGVYELALSPDDVGFKGGVREYFEGLGLQLHKEDFPLLF